MLFSHNQNIEFYKSPSYPFMKGFLLAFVNIKNRLLMKIVSSIACLNLQIPINQSDNLPLWFKEN